MKRLVVILILFALPAAADDDLYRQFQKFDNAARYKWALALSRGVWPDDPISRQERRAMYIVGCAKEFAPIAGVRFDQFVGLCGAMAEADVN